MDIKELQKNAEEGSVVARSALGICYLHGRDVQVDYSKAFQLLTSAADEGATRAIVNLAQMYAHGLGMPKNIGKAIRLYESVKEVEPRAQLELARIYSRGEDVPVDPTAAKRFYSAVASREGGDDDVTTAVLVGAITFEEIVEAKTYLRTTT